MRAGGARLEEVEELEGEGEVGQVVQGPGVLDAVDGGLARGEQAARVVDEDVEARVSLLQLGGDPTHLGLRREVGDDRLDPRVAALRLQLGDGRRGALGSRPTRTTVAP